MSMSSDETGAVDVGGNLCRCTSRSAVQEWRLWSPHLSVAGSSRAVGLKVVAACVKTLFVFCEAIPGHGGQRLPATCGGQCFTGFILECMGYVNV